MKQEVVWLINEKYGGSLARLTSLQGGDVGGLTDKAKKDITLLEKGVPVDYVIGHKNFCGCKIDLREKPLIPRDETEFWIKQLIKNLRGSDSSKFIGEGSLKVLDMFAGSGCCGIAVLKSIPKSFCDFVDIEDNCLKQISNLCFDPALNFL